MQSPSTHRRQSLDETQNCVPIDDLRAAEPSLKSEKFKLNRLLANYFEAKLNLSGAVDTFIGEVGVLTGNALKL